MFRYCPTCTSRDTPEADEISLYSADADGGNLTQVTSDLLGHDYLEEFSPDGKSMLVSSFVKEIKDEGVPGNLYVMSIDGKQRVTITESYTRGPYSPWRNAVWLEDGSGRIAFVQRSPNARWGIYVANPDGSAQSLIAEATGHISGIRVLPQNTFMWWETTGNESWSPFWQLGADEATKETVSFAWEPLYASGNTVVWYRQSELFYEHWYHVVSIGPMDDPAGSQEICRVPGVVGPAKVSVSPDRTKMFLVDGDPWNSSNYYVCSTDGASVILLPAWQIGAAPFPPSWSSDNRYLLFEFREEFVLNIFDLETNTVSLKFYHWINPGNEDNSYTGTYSPAFDVVWIPEPK